MHMSDAGALLIKRFQLTLKKLSPVKTSALHLSMEEDSLEFMEL